MLTFVTMILCGKKSALRLLLIVLLINIKSTHTHAASIDTVRIPSKAMNKTFPCVIITPTKQKKKQVKYPVVYLLHGYAGSYNNWIKKVPELSTYADAFQLMVVCPDGGFSSWYFDSPIDSTMRYETYIGVELPAYIDKHYPTIPNRRSRAITGLSMGGHGGLFLGFRHADIFGAAGSMSGGVNLDAVRNRFDVIKRIGDTLAYASNWEKYSVANIIEKYPSDSIAIIIDCGTEDFFYAINHKLHEKMLQLKIPHEYIERPGKHDWIYWGNAVKYQLFYFRNYFNKSAAASNLSVRPLP